MKRAYTKVPELAEIESSVDQWTGLNAFGPHADLKPGEFRIFTNFDNFGDYIKTRRGSKKFNPAITPGRDIFNHVVFDAGADEYAVLQLNVIEAIPSEFKFIKLTGDGTYMDVLNKTSLTPFTLDTVDKTDMFVSNGKIYLFHPSGNSILEFDTPEFPGGFVRRKMGLPGPQIAGVNESPEPGGLIGKRIYAVELVYKDTTVTPNVDIIVSGPNRAVEVTGDITFEEGRFLYVETDTTNPQSYTVHISATTNDGSLLTDIENDNWTHIRLYRTKDISTLTNVVPDLAEGGETEITGFVGEVYQVQEQTKAQFLTTLDECITGGYCFNPDFILDDDLPFPKSVVTEDKMDLFPVPAAAVGVFHRDRIWASGITRFPGPQGVYALQSIESKIFYTPFAKTQYSEQVGALNAIESEPGDGEKMIGLYPLREDLIGIKEGKTGRVPYGDPKSGWITEDSVIGIVDRDHAHFVPNIGICAIVNDQDDFRIFGYDLAWHSDLYGLQVSRPIRDLISGFNLTDLDFVYMNGKLMISGGRGFLLVLAVEQKKGWSLYSYPLNNLSEAFFTFDEGRRALILNSGQPVIEIESGDGAENTNNSDYVAVTDDIRPITWQILTHRWQDNKGRSLVEERFLSLVAKLDTNIACTAFVNGRIWNNGVPFNMLVPPQDYLDPSLRETEYQGYSEYRAVGNYIHYNITGFAPSTIYSIMLNMLVQRGVIPTTFDPFGLLEGARTLPDWVQLGILQKDAGDEDRDTLPLTKNDAGDTTRDNNDYQQDDAGDENRESN